ncbi:tRNA N(3)-methylcytidine methyltransferase METTL6 isoform X2 [Lepus europaeus]|uniref:tRNA N(3)-methylcytidine methyltransferase METTL6 isoform X2 n=1 Tax=Lepus europaeus TaxID=9983 RepID=UPI002B476D8F|nr:tRNA N(3)-methylcytidine methyltransferase METTL6 isoform X2 [Lepus europaeus]
MASLQRKELQARILSSEEEEKLKRDQVLVSHFKQQKLEKEAQKNWDLFYKRNSTNFFKDRHWTTREFEELRSCREFEGQKLTVLEAGCGVGNCLFPLLEEDLNIFAYACDFSPRAVEYVKVLKPGKSVLFRDYGLYDHAMLRFKAGSKLGENFYVRQDGTRSYFFTKEFLARLFADTGYEEVVNEYVLRETVNKKEGLCVPRVFLQSKFQKSPKNPNHATLGLGHQVGSCASPLDKESLR